MTKQNCLLPDEERYLLHSCIEPEFSQSVMRGLCQKQAGLCGARAETNSTWKGGFVDDCLKGLCTFGAFQVSTKDKSQLNAAGLQKRLPTHVGRGAAGI